MIAFMTGLRYFRTVFYHFKLKFGTTGTKLCCKQPVQSAKVIGDGRRLFIPFKQLEGQDTLYFEFAY